MFQLRALEHVRHYVYLKKKIANLIFLFYNSTMDLIMCYLPRTIYRCDKEFSVQLFHVKKMVYPIVFLPRLCYRIYIQSKYIF